MAQRSYVTAQYQNDPLGFLIKLMDLEAYENDLRSIPDGLTILTGILTYRHLRQTDRVEINRAIAALPQGRVRLKSRLMSIITLLSVQPYWFAWSLSDQELRAYYQENHSFAKAIETIGLDFNSLTVGSLATGVLYASKDGVRATLKGALSNASGRTAATEAAQKLGFSGANARTLGIAGAMVTIFAGTMHLMTSHSAKQGRKELALRGLLNIEDF